MSSDLDDIPPLSDGEGCDAPSFEVPAETADALPGATAGPDGEWFEKDNVFSIDASLTPMDQKFIEIMIHPSEIDELSHRELSLA